MTSLSQNTLKYQGVTKWPYKKASTAFGFRWIFPMYTLVTLYQPETLQQILRESPPRPTSEG